MRMLKARRTRKVKSMQRVRRKFPGKASWDWKVGQRA
jgi:hypothetical protein